MSRAPTDERTWTVTIRLDCEHAGLHADFKRLEHELLALVLRTRSNTRLLRDHLIKLQFYADSLPGDEHDQHMMAAKRKR
jgi:hypothetical protein